MLKCLYVPRIGGPDLLWTVNYLARSDGEWDRPCDLRLARLISCIHHTSNCKQDCHVENQAVDCKLRFFQDANFSGNSAESKSTSGCARCIFDLKHLCRFHGLVKSKQLYPRAAQKLTLFRLMQGSAWRRRSTSQFV